MYVCMLPRFTAGETVIIMLTLPLKLLKKKGEKVLKIAAFDNPTVV